MSMGLVQQKGISSACAQKLYNCNIDDLVQDRGNSCALAMDLPVLH